MPSFSIVIPAHNEAGVIERCLNAFLPFLRPGEAEVVVVANGCTDDTAARASAHPGVLLVELLQAGKAGALDGGDAACTALPRVYLDADIVLSADCLRALAAALSADLPLVAAPAAKYETTGRPWVVRAFYNVYTKMPYVRVGMVGSGVYALSAAGRARFDAFPARTADDLYVQRLFNLTERIVLADHTFTVQTPKSLKGLVAVRTRTAYGNKELAEGDGNASFAESTNDSAAALLRLVISSPSLLPAAFVYTCITLMARRRASRRQAPHWDRDTSTR